MSRTSTADADSVSRGSLTIRRLSYSDLPSVIAIERRSFTTPWSLAMFVLELSKPAGICLAVVDEDEQLVAYLVCSRYDNLWHLMNIAVDPSRRRQGVATELIDELFARTRDGRVTLEVRVSNLSAIRMYEGFGFRSAGLRRGYYHDNDEDALIMWRAGPRTRERRESAAKHRDGGGGRVMPARR